MAEESRHGAHRAPIGWNRVRKEQAATDGRPPDTQPSPEASPDPQEASPDPQEVEVRPDPPEAAVAAPEPSAPAAPAEVAPADAAAAEPSAPAVTAEPVAAQPADEPAPFEPAPAEEAPEAPPSEPIPVPAEPVVAPSEYHYLKRWTFVLVEFVVVIPAAAIGLALYYWWFHSLDKTSPVFVVLVYVIVCAVGGLLLAMVQRKPVVAGIAIALLSAPFWSVAAAAVLHGTYFCEHASRCLVGLIPY